MKKLMYIILLASFVLTACGKADVKAEKKVTVEQEAADEVTIEQETADEETAEQETTEKENTGGVASETSEESNGQADSDKQTSTSKPSTSTAQSPSENTTQKPSTSPSTNTAQKPSTSPSTGTTTQSPSNDVEDSSNDATNESVTDSQLKSEAETNASKYMNYYQEVLRLVNEIRAEAGVQPLTLDMTLCRAASMRAVEMDYNNIMSHTRPDGSDWWTVLDSYGASYGTCGENVAAGYRTPASVVTGWKNSPGHYSNMINASFTKLGVGYSSAGVGDYGHYWCQLFSN